jgi:hypothetical protein
MLSAMQACPLSGVSRHLMDQLEDISRESKILLKIAQDPEVKTTKSTQILHQLDVIESIIQSAKDLSTHIKVFEDVLKEGEAK